MNFIAGGGGLFVPITAFKMLQDVVKDTVNA